MVMSVCSCGLRFANVVDLQLHNMDCKHFQSRRRSDRIKKKTPKGEAYSQSLAENDKEEDTEVMI